MFIYLQANKHNKKEEVHVSVALDFTGVTTMLNQLLPVIVNVAMIAAILSVIFGVLMPMFERMFR